MNHADMDIRRKVFFNAHAEGWLNQFYANPETGAIDRYTMEFDRLFSLVSLHEGDVVLDLGCGCGVLVPHILDRIGPEGSLYEVDYAEQMIAVNQRLHPDSRITFLVNSAESLDIPDNSVDTVICFACFPHFHRKADTLYEIGRTLKPRGTLTIAHFGSADEINSHHGKHECVKHDHLPQTAEMRDLLSGAGFRIDEFIDEHGFYCVRTVKSAEAR